MQLIINQLKQQIRGLTVSTVQGFEVIDEGLRFSL